MYVIKAYFVGQCPTKICKCLVVYRYCRTINDLHHNFFFHEESAFTQYNLH